MWNLHFCYYCVFKINEVPWKIWNIASLCSSVWLYSVTQTNKKHRSDIYLPSALQTTCFTLIVSDSGDWMTRTKRNPSAMTLAMALTHPVHSSHSVLIPHSHLSLLSHACTHTHTHTVRQPAGQLTSHPLSWVGSPPHIQTCIQLWLIQASAREQRHFCQHTDIQPFALVPAAHH